MSRITRSTHINRFIVGAALAFAGMFATACGTDDPQVPTTFTPAAGVTAALTGTVATTVNPAPKVQILDASGKGIKGIVVHWKVGTGSGGVANDSSTTDGSGVALSGGWTLGAIAGTQTLTATASGVPTVTFTAQAVAGPATTLIRLGPSTQQATVGTEVPVPPSVRAEDVFGNVVAGVQVTFSVATGGGTITGETQVTNAAGIATATSWKLGTVAGQQIARATAPNVTQTVFSATALPGPPASMVKIAGDNQDAITGLPIAISPGVRVVDAFGNPVGNIPITFTPGPNSGTVLNGTVLTDPATGTAFVGNWIVGPGPNPTLIATSTSLPGVSLVFTANVVSSQFNIVVRYVGEPPSVVQQQAVARAVAKWRSVVVTSSGLSRQVLPAASCGRSWMPAVDTTITNVIIYANIGPIDGVGGTLGNANLCRLHDSGLAAIGTMLFDTADLTDLESRGLIDAVITHEMGHVLGIGSGWQGTPFLVDRGLSDPIFTGPVARAQFDLVGGAIYSGRPVPVENTGGAGTRDVHWRESVFKNELMTGFINLGFNPLSRVSVGSLADLGFVVTYTGVDSYTLTSSLLAPLAEAGTVIELGNDIAPIPARERAAAGLDRPIKRR